MFVSKEADGIDSWVWDDDHTLIHQACLSACWVSNRNHSPITWRLAVVLQWLRTNAGTAVWSHMLLWLEEPWKVIGAIESRLRTSPTRRQQQSTAVRKQKAPVVWGTRRCRGYGRLASKDARLGATLNSTRDLSTGVRQGSRWHRGRSSLHAGDPHEPTTHAKVFRLRNASRINEPLWFHKERRLVVKEENEEDKRDDILWRTKWDVVFFVLPLKKEQ